MADHPRIAIVGAGIIGCAAAFELSRRGARVLVLDGRQPGGGATQASAGILAPYTEAHEGSELFDLAVRGLSVYDDFVSRVRSVTDRSFEYRRSGTIEVAESEARARELHDRLSAPWARAAGLEWLEPEQLREAQPGINPTHSGGLLCRTHGHVAANDFLVALVDAAQKLGAEFKSGVSVNGLEPAADHYLLRTTAGVEHADLVLLCAGSWTSALDPLSEGRDRVRPIRGQLVRLSRSPVLVSRVLWGTGCYIVPREDGSLLVGATAEDVGFDERATAQGVMDLLMAAARMVPGLGAATFEGVRVGLRPATDDGLPLIGSRRDGRLFLATGHFRNGILLAPLTAQLLADQMLKPIGA